jgi:hypothetical protein
MFGDVTLMSGVMSSVNVLVRAYGPPHLWPRIRSGTSLPGLGVDRVTASTVIVSEK